LYYKLLGAKSFSSSNYCQSRRRKRRLRKTAILICSECIKAGGEVGEAGLVARIEVKGGESLLLLSAKVGRGQLAKLFDTKITVFLFAADQRTEFFLISFLVFFFI